MPLLFQRTPVKKRRSKPRINRPVDKKYMAWLANGDRMCLLFGREGTACGGRLTVAHIRRYGEAKNDRRTCLLCESHHQYGPHAIHTMGREKWSAFFEVDLEIVMSESVSRYERETNAD